MRKGTVSCVFEVEAGTPGQVCNLSRYIINFPPGRKIGLVPFRSHDRMNMQADCCAVPTGKPGEISQAGTLRITQRNPSLRHLRPPSR